MTPALTRPATSGPNGSGAWRRDAVSGTSSAPTASPAPGGPPAPEEARGQVRRRRLHQAATARLLAFGVTTSTFLTLLGGMALAARHEEAPVAPVVSAAPPPAPPQVRVVRLVYRPVPAGPAPTPVTTIRPGPAPLGSGAPRPAPFPSPGTGVGAPSRVLCPGGAQSLASVPAALEDDVIEAAERCPGECIYIEP